MLSPADKLAQKSPPSNLSVGIGPQMDFAAAMHVVIRHGLAYC
jgi:hypothetical protein